MRYYSVNSFKHDEAGPMRYQAFFGGLPITRELDDRGDAVDAALAAFENDRNDCDLRTWDGTTGETVTVAEKRGGKVRTVCIA